MMIKGHTVHFGTTDGVGVAACGTKPRSFLGKPAITADVRRVTCPACEKLAPHACARCGQVGVGPCGCGFQNEVRPVCTNCGQWVHVNAAGLALDCSNECVRRGFAQAVQA